MPILPYQVLSSLVPAVALRIGEPIYVTTLLTDPAFTRLRSGQSVLINRQPGNLVVYMPGGDTRSILRKADLQFEGGAVQMIDNLLVPPGALNATLISFQGFLFLGALDAVDAYSQMTNNSRNCTIFAPSVPVFQVINGTLSNMSVTTLREVVYYYIISDIVLPSTALLNDTDYSSLLHTFSPGLKLHIHRSGNNLYVNSAQVIQSDILLSNGILHIIDNVLNSNVSDPAINPDRGA